MKQILLIAVIVIVLMGLMACKGSKNVVQNPVPKGQLVKFHYAEYGTMAQPNFEYTLQRQPDGKVTLCVFRPWVEEGWGDTITTTAAVLTRVEKMIKDNNLQNYKSHYSPDVEVLDGYSWGYEAEFDDSVTISSGGSNAGPGDRTLDVIGQYLDTCYAQVKGIKLQR